MTPWSLSWLLRLAALCHLTILLAGQHHGVNKCSFECKKMTSKISVARLLSYEHNHQSCGRRAIILKTKQHRFFCADPAEKWVQEAMEQLDHRAAVLTQNGGMFEKQIGVGELITTPAARGLYQSAVSEPEAAVESSTLELTSPSQEAQTASGTSPELPTRVPVSLGTRSPSASEIEDERPPSSGPEGTALFSVATVTTMISTTIGWPSSVPSQAGSSLLLEGKVSEVPTTEIPSTETPSTQASSTEPPTVSHPATKHNVGLEGQTARVKDQSPVPENAPESAEMGSVLAHTEAFLDWGPGSMAHASVIPVSSEEGLSKEPGAQGSWAPNAEEEPIHATVDPQRLGVLITPVPDSQAATRRQAVGLLAFLGLLFCLGVAMFAYQSLQGCSRKVAGEMVEGLRYVPRSCGSNSYVLVPV
ncbi:fractalkine [Rhynchocyon petersi]